MPASSSGNHLENRLEVFAIDLRSLAAFRICTGLLVLFDLASRLRFLSLHYTDRGLVPRAMVGRVLSSSPLAIHYVSGSLAWELFLFGATAVFAGMLLAGYRTRLATVALWVLMLSLLQRNFMVTDAGDSLLPLLLFWSMFLPLGARWSVDAGRGCDGRVLSPASAALLLQVGLLYLFAGLAKDSAAWRDGSALAQALGQSLWVRPAGEWLRAQPDLSAAFTHGSRLFEVFGPLLLFSPLRTALLRQVGIAAFVAFQLGLALCLELNLFPFYSSLGLVAFLPRSPWERLQRRLPALRPASPETRALPGRPRGGAGRLADAVVLVSLVLGVVAGVGYQLRRPLLPDPLRYATGLLGLEQHWEMYRYVVDFDARIRTRGILDDGSGIDFATHRDGAPWEPLRRVLSDYRGKAYLERFWGSGVGHHQAFSRWVCRTWNGGSPAARRLVRLELELERVALGTGGQRGEPRYEALYRHTCEP